MPDSNDMLDDLGFIKEVSYNDDLGHWDGWVAIPALKDFVNIDMDSLKSAAGRWPFKITEQTVDRVWQEICDGGFGYIWTLVEGWNPEEGGSVDPVIHKPVALSWLDQITGRRLERVIRRTKGQSIRQMFEVAWDAIYLGVPYKNDPNKKFRAQWKKTKDNRKQGWFGLWIEHQEGDKTVTLEQKTALARLRAEGIDPGIFIKAFREPYEKIRPSIQDAVELEEDEFERIFPEDFSDVQAREMLELSEINISKHHREGVAYIEWVFDTRILEGYSLMFVLHKDRVVHVGIYRYGWDPASDGVDS